MLSLKGTVLWESRAIFRADVSDVSVQSTGEETPRRELQKRSKLWFAGLSVSQDCSLMRPLQVPSFER